MTEKYNYCDFEMMAACRAVAAQPAQQESEYTFTYEQVKAHIQAAMISDRDACAEICNHYLSFGGLSNPDLDDHLAVRSLLKECKEALAQPEQEPVAWMEIENFVDDNNLWDSRTTFNQQGKGEPLYTKE